MYTPPLNQANLLEVLDELYLLDRSINREDYNSFKEAVDNSKIFKNVRFLDIDPLDPDKFVESNPSTKVVSNPITFSAGNKPTDDGLLSEEIFGITKAERSGIFGYIDLQEQFIHPYYYKMWLGLEKRLRECIYETNTFIIDDEGYLKADPNGETGIKFLVKNKNKLMFKNTKKSMALNVLLDGKKRNKLFITKQIVIPPFYRDVNTKEGGRLGIGEINKLYVTLLNNTKALKESSEFGFDILGATRGKIQDTLFHIYNWFTDGETDKGEEHTGSGIFRKFGIMRRANLGKTTDYSARLVLSAPNINKESREDFIVDTDHCSAPLSAVIACAYPLMIFHLNRFFNNLLSGSNYITVPDRFGKVMKFEVVNPLIQFSNDRFDREMNEFIHGYSNRIKPVTIEIKNSDKPINLKFKGYNITEEDFLKGVRDDESRMIERDLTWVDVLFICANEALQHRVGVITRYPIDSYFNHLHLKVNISSTKNTIPMVINGVHYKWYPDIKQSDIGSNTSNKFIDTLSILNPFCKLMGAD